eukprot:1170156-Prymnesium_polylepis.1
MIPQHSPITQGSAHLPEARAAPWCRHHPRPAPSPPATQNVWYVRIALTAWLCWGGGAHHAVRPLRQRVRPLGQHV